MITRAPITQVPTTGGWGWRLSPGLAGIPAFLLTVGTLLVVDTPNSLIERSRLEEGKVVLRKIRGTGNIEHEFLELVEGSHIAKEVKHPFRKLLQRMNQPQFVISIALQRWVVDINEHACKSLKLNHPETQVRNF
ncbi:unnamed protein product [Lupinus luteus]|uniref:Uncharacterized protein n=1 Tax=Lupinus luteus TaxID=3873 RepID=A0AAV1WB74_LUPLU